MPVKQLKDYLDSHHIKYVSTIHSCAYTAQEIAASAHVKGKDLAKTVMVKLDGKLTMVVLPASSQIDFERLKAKTGTGAAELATEQEFEDKFPGCDLGAMPPFGNLYGMDVYLEKKLTDDEQFAFNAGTHTELIKLSFKNYKDLVDPEIIEF